METQNPDQNGLQQRWQVLKSEIKVQLLAPIIAQVNALKTYPLTDDMIEMWAKIIAENRPWCTPAHLDRVIQRFVIEDDTEWDQSKGIQNLMTGMLRIKRID